MVPRAFSGGPDGEICLIQKIPKNKNGSKFYFTPFLFFGIFCMRHISPSGPPEKALGTIIPTFFYDFIQ